MVCLCLLRGQDNDLSLIDGVGVHKTVNVALEDGLVLHHIAIGRLGDSTQRIASLDGIEGFAAGGSRGVDAGNLTQLFGQNKRCALRQLCTLVDLAKLSLHAISTVVVQRDRAVGVTLFHGIRASGSGRSGLSRGGLLELAACAASSRGTRIFKAKRSCSNSFA